MMTMMASRYSRAIFVSYPVTRCLIVANVIIFALSLSLSDHYKMAFDYGVVPNNFVNVFLSIEAFGDNMTKIFTSMFMHANIIHLILNLVALSYFGSLAERMVGARKYVGMYLAAGMTGALLHTLIMIFVIGNGDSSLVGASGSISGMLGVAAAFGNRGAYYLIAIEPVVAIIGYFFLGMPMGFVAHIGGFLAGLLFTKIIIMRSRKKEHPPGILVPRRVIANNYS